MRSMLSRAHCHHARSLDSVGGLTCDHHAVLVQGTVWLSQLRRPETRARKASPNKSKRIAAVADKRAEAF